MEHGYWVGPFYLSMYACIMPRQWFLKIRVIIIYQPGLHRTFRGILDNSNNVCKIWCGGVSIRYNTVISHSMHSNFPESIILDVLSKLLTL